MKTLVIAALWVLLAVSPVSAQPNRQFADWQPRWEQIDRNVESQPGVWNPTQCGWDIDDHIEIFPKLGYLEPGQTVVASDCFVAGPITGWGVNPNWTVTVNDPQLIVSICLPVQGWCLPAASGRCVAGPRYKSGAAELAVIPDSNGGIGVMSSVEFRVTNPTSRRIRDIFITPQGGGDQSVCGYGPGTLVDGGSWVLTWREPL